MISFYANDAKDFLQISEAIDKVFVTPLSRFFERFVDLPDRREFPRGPRIRGLTKKMAVSQANSSCY